MLRKLISLSNFRTLKKAALKSIILGQKALQRNLSLQFEYKEPYA